MADTKLSALTELAATPASDDEVYIRDVSEAAAQESKRITIANLLAGAGGATIATGNYTGNDADDRQIAVGFKCSMVILGRSTGGQEALLIPNLSLRINTGAILTGTTALHGTDGINVSTTNDNANNNGMTFYYWAISE